MTFQRYNRSFLSKAVGFLFLIAVTLPCVSPAFACGPFELDVIFSLSTHPGLPVEDYTKGKEIGIVPRTYSAMPLVVFYRYLNGAPLSADESRDAAAAMENKIFYLGSSTARHQDKPDAETVSPTGVWTTARAKVTSETVSIDTDRSIEYYSYTNCLQDAFASAADTLNARIASYGVNDDIKEWVKGQDLVFANCSSDVILPAEVSGPEWLKKDRDYQIAAALFYQKNSAADARTALRKVASDKGSPWQKTARYLIARTWIREASLLTAPEGEESQRKLDAQRRELLSNAEKDLLDIIKDDSMSAFRDSAMRLLGLAKFRADGDKRRVELASILTANSGSRNFYNDLTDYGLLAGSVYSAASEAGRAIEQKEAENAGKEYDYNYQLKLRDIDPKYRTDELTDWIFSYQSVDGYAHSLERWRAGRKLHWLVAALGNAAGNSPDVNDLLAEAAKIGRSSPAFATVRYHEVRLLIEQGKLDAARPKLEEVGSITGLPVSTQNDFRELRTSLARNLDEFLTAAQRDPAAFSWNDNDREEPVDMSSEEGKLGIWAKRKMFDHDSVIFLNEKVPLSVLKQAATNTRLPEYLRAMVIQAAWTRAFVLKDQASERELAPLIAAAMKTDGPLFQKYVSAAGAADREAAAFVALLRYPVLQPYLSMGYGRADSDPADIDSIRGNWWCYRHDSDQVNFSIPKFLTPEQTAQAEREQKQLAAAGESATYLTRRALEFAARNPSHPQTPEILHLAVRTTRYGCKDSSTGKYSKQAFDLLHRQYASSPWTKQTPYWFQ